MKKFIIITTINEENDVLRKFASFSDWTLIIVGDRKGPTNISLPNTIFLDIDKQKELGFEFAKFCPENHYSRKNIGYLYAMSKGADIIAESDDDNLPANGWGDEISFNHEKILNGKGFYNVYNLYSDEFIWPRGYPLEEINATRPANFKSENHKIGAWQFLADGSPDVDAIYRLTRKEDIEFKKFGKIGLNPGLYCPFNSQNTFWTREAFWMMYLPISVTFRFTDILRGYVAQRLFWDQNMVLGFGDANVFQDRNIHDLMRDFRDEIPMYTELIQIIDLFNTISLSNDPLEAILQLYQEMFKRGFVFESEIEGVGAWITDCQKLKSS